MKKSTMQDKYIKIVVAVLVILSLAGCSGRKMVNNSIGDVTSSQESTKQNNEATSDADSETTSTTENETIESDKIQTVTISAAGDVTLGTNQKQSYKGSFHEMYDKKGSKYFLKNVRDIFEKDDFTIVNLEGTLTTSTDRMDKLWNHKGDPKYVKVLSSSSVEAVTLGNNHIMDYGMQGITDTIRTVCNAGITYGMSGEWGNNYGIYQVANGITIGYVSVNEHYEGEAVYAYLDEGYDILKERGADIILACLHWGDDKTHVIAEGQYALGKKCIDKGYDVVLGCHPHVLQGIEIYKGKYIVYSMGNFCYGGNKNPDEKDSMIWQQTFTFVDGQLKSSEAKVIPCSLSSVDYKNDYCPKILTGSEAKALFKRLNTYCEEFGTYVDNDGRIHQK